VEHLYVKFGDPGCSGFLDIVRKNRLQTQTNGASNNIYTHRVNVLVTLETLCRDSHVGSRRRSWKAWLPNVSDALLA